MAGGRRYAGGVEEIDHGWTKAKRAILSLDGLRLDIGIQSTTIRYPKTAGGKQGAEVYKVAAIHGIHNAISETFEGSDSEISAGLTKLHDLVTSGTRVNEPELIYALLGKPLRDKIRAEVGKKVTYRTGRMKESIRASVFERSSMTSRGPFAAGDDPKKPTASQKVPPP